MAEIDYQMALLLQHRFEQEYKASRNAQSSDEQLARQLQEQFEQEEAVERPKSDLVYEPPISEHNTSRSLVDPSWELVDPTPDIHNLFMVFNQRFFWNKLLAVCVAWSKRMTSCAGICAYNGRGGMCRITLSAPLLKLRPRKDLVETLLHEMIHAFLFVTHNNRDRDGHGPEFHKHMYRINKAAGTNITVYHSFHDEVRLYQQHWWRCNGPCQHWKPYFGMVRRASNRAPGPNDRWWGDHFQRCGGTFVKVKEPEKRTQKQGKPEQKNIVSDTKSKDIRNFMVPSSTSSSVSNVKGFKDLTTKVQGKYNSSSTIVVTKNTKTNSETIYKPTVFNATTTGATVKKTETNNRVDTSTTNECTGDFLAVRNHWANKFGNTSKPNNKRPAQSEPSTSSKIQRVPNSVPPDDFCDCPVCNKKVLLSELNNHLDKCLCEPSKATEPEVPGSSKEETNECPVCNTQIKCSLFDVHVEQCVKRIYDGVEEKLGNKESPETISCLACGKKILKTNLSIHLEDCMIDIFDVDFDEAKEEVKNSVDTDDKQTKSEFNCPFCMKLVNEAGMKQHLDSCLQADSADIVESLVDDAF